MLKTPICQHILMCLKYLFKFTPLPSRNGPRIDTNILC